MGSFWGSVAGALGSIYANKQAKDAQKDQNEFTASQNAANIAAQPKATQDAILWAQQQNLGNQTWAQQQNQTAMNAAGKGTSTGAFGASNRYQRPDGTWEVNTKLNSGDQSTLDALRWGNTTGVGNLDMSGQYGVNSTYARNFDALNRPALERNQEAQRSRAAAMGLGWGSGEANNTLTGQLNDEQTRFGLAVQNAGHDAYNADQTTLRNNLLTNNSLIQGISDRQETPPDWAPYATVNAPTTQAPTSGEIDWKAGGWGSVGGTGTGGSGGYTGGALTGSGGTTHPVTGGPGPVRNRSDTWTGGSIAPSGSIHSTHSGQYGTVGDGTSLNGSKAIGYGSDGSGNQFFSQYGGVQLPADVDGREFRGATGQPDGTYSENPLTNLAGAWNTFNDRAFGIPNALLPFGLGMVAELAAPKLNDPEEDSFLPSWLNTDSLPSLPSWASNWFSPEAAAATRAEQQQQAAAVAAEQQRQLQAEQQAVQAAHQAQNTSSSSSSWNGSTHSYGGGNIGTSGVTSYSTPSSANNYNGSGW